MTNKTPGQVAYESELIARQNYHDGTPRRTWAQLSSAVRDTWERNPTPRWSIGAIERNETTRCLTDRWGEMLDLDPPATAEQACNVVQLLGAMWDELTFIVEYQGKPGILFESEYDDGIAPNAAGFAKLAAICAAHPYATGWVTQGGHVFAERYALRVFVPMGEASAERSAAIGHAILELPYPQNQAALDGTDGQDRDSYSDTQDRESYQA